MMYLTEPPEIRWTKQFSYGARKELDDDIDLFEVQKTQYLLLC